MATSRRRLSALHAQRIVSVAGIQVGPALSAGAVAGMHASSVGAGLLVVGCVLAAAAGFESRQFPLRLMPLGSTFGRLLAPLLGIALALAVSVTLAPLSVAGLVPALLAAWLVLGVALGVIALLTRRLGVRVGIVGSPALTDSMARELALAGMSDYEIVGWIDFTDEMFDPHDFPAGPATRRLGTLDELDSLIAAERIDLLVFGVRESEREAQRQFGVSSIDVLERVTTACLGVDVRLIGATQLFEDLFGHVALATMNAAWFQYMLHPRFRGTPRLAKRALDLALGGVIGVAAVPIVALAAVAIKLEGGGAVLYRQRRVGEGGREFELLKLRTMRDDAEDAQGARWATPDDPRVTRVGRMLRKLHLDELPQVWNILRGEMSAVGPRPERPELVAALERDLPFYDRRQLVKPGLTGWAQVRCGYSGTESGSAWKLAHDLYYLKRRSPALDVLILVETLATPVRDARKLTRLPDERLVLQRLGLKHAAAKRGGALRG